MRFRDQRAVNAALPRRFPSVVEKIEPPSTEAGPALYLAKLFGSNDTEAVVRLIKALLVLVLDPLAVLLTLAASRDNRGWDSGRIGSPPRRG
jgi:hypothetical protein